MKAELTYTFESLDELAEFTAKMARPVPLAVLPVAASTEMESVAVVDVSRATKVRKTKAAAGPEAPAPETSADDEPAEVLGEEQVRQAISAVNEKFGLNAARKVLRQFNANRIPELKVEQYAEFVKACNAVK